MRRIVCSECLEYLKKLRSRQFSLIYIDPPFNTGRKQKRSRIRVVQDDAGERSGFGGRRYRTESVESPWYPDTYDNFTQFLEPRLREAYRLLSDDGSLFLHLDYREVHYAKVLLDEIFGRDNFLNEIIWAYDYGARAKNRWPAKHDNILWYAKDPERYIFNYHQIDRIPYMAPDLVGPEKAARGKTPTDVWWQTVVPTNGKEKTGYPTQKPLKLLERIVRVHSNAGDTVLDFFAGSGTTGEAAARLGRGFVLVDEGLEACRIMARRLDAWKPRLIGFK
ncbi:MAG: site-specific DNA-methyltransferase [Deinococcus sp.]|nr:site-specific DNA-methyltransferase [Deinococcus sp.]MCL5964608.1 site-specific DNA-methyltransferase [Deinococcus sp.]